MKQPMGYRLRQHSNGEFSFHAKDKAWRGSLGPLMLQAARYVPREELTAALVDMRTRKHTVAEFGLARTFIYSLNDGLRE